MILAGRKVLITGSLVRTGRYLALKMAENGASVCVHGRQTLTDVPQLLDELRDVGAPSASFVAADVTDPDQVQRMAQMVCDAFGSIDTLVNNVGVYDPKPLADIDARHWRWTFAGNLDATFYCAQAFMSQLLSIHGVGWSIWATPVVIVFVLPPKVLPIKSQEQEFICSVKSLARAHAGSGLTVNTLSPGNWRTPSICPKMVTFPRAERAGLMNLPKPCCI